MWLRLFGIALFLVGIMVGLAGTTNMWEQDRAARVYQPVQAVVLQSSVETHHSGRSTTYEPHVSYRYSVNGIDHESEELSVWGESFDLHSSAQHFIDHYPADAIVTAYRDPDDAAKVVLVQDYSSGPYWMGLGGFYAAWLGIMMTAGATRSGPAGMRAVPMGDGGWTLLLPPKNLKKRARESLAWWVGTAAIVGLVAGHYVLRAQHWGVGGYFLLVVAAGWLVLQTALTFRHWGVQRAVSDARVMVTPVPLKREGPVSVRVELDALRPLRIESASTKIVCVEHYQEKRGNKTSSGTRTKGERPLDICSPKAIAAGEMVEGEATAHVDPDWPPTSADEVHYPYYTWELRVRLKFTGAADYQETFIITAE